MTTARRNLVIPERIRPSGVLGLTHPTQFAIEERPMAQPYQTYQDAAVARDGDTQDAIRQLKQKAGDMAETVADEGAKAMKAAGETAGDAFAATKRFVQDQPYVAIGAGAATPILWSVCRTTSNRAIGRCAGASSGCGPAGAKPIRPPADGLFVAGNRSVI
jgi:ElaB/YqjD/DUF883 family membrane-anchored ribosome-binding protein